MRWGTRTGLVILAALLGGCEQVTELREFLDGRIVLSRSPEPGQSHMLIVDLFAPPEVTADCCGLPLSKDTRASINGVALTVVSRGGQNGSFLPSCENPRFLYDTRAAGDVLSARLVIDDDRTRWDIVMPHLFQRRELRLITPADGVLRPGSEGVMDDSVPSDILVGADFEELAGNDSNYVRVTMYSRPSGTNAGAFFARVEGSTLRFKMQPYTQPGRPPEAVTIETGLELQPYVERFDPPGRRPVITFGPRRLSAPATLVSDLAP